MPDTTTEMLGQVDMRREEVDRGVEAVLQALDDPLSEVGADESEVAAAKREEHQPGEAIAEREKRTNLIA